MKKMRLFQLILMASATTTLAATPNWTPDPATISKLESSIKSADIPWNYGGQHAISEYARYYAASMAGDHRIIQGEWIIPLGAKMKSAGVYIFGSRKEFPTVSDGGCAIINLVYDIETARIVSLRCNGLA